MEKALGKEHNLVGHALISYEVGGALHGYFYPNAIKGTGLATKQLARLSNDLADKQYDGYGPCNKIYDKYEFVIFTRDDIAGEEVGKLNNEYLGKSEEKYSQLRTMLNAVAPYAEEAEINPYETISFPERWKYIGGRSAIFCAFKPDCFDKKFGLMLIMEIFPSELHFKTIKGGKALIKLLKGSGHYPYSDLNRKPVA
ncbi:MAG: hypothetical protein COA91_02800 [Robiginitomaculum sp.]|nr:MAG: hypothetical protein COA91_02800 [Robiginitomaculum sp.]